MTAATIWVDLFKMVNLRGRARRVFGPMIAFPILSPLAPWSLKIESLASGSGTFVRLFHSASRNETVYWLLPNAIINVLGDLNGGQIDMLDILDRPPRPGEIGYEVFAARFSASGDAH